MGLFRKEVLEHRAGRLHGDVHVALPLSWQIIGYLMVGAVVFGILFLSLAKYSRIETVAGAIVPNGGILRIESRRAGVVSSLSVEEGELVAAGQELAVIRTDENLMDGSGTSIAILQLLDQQADDLAFQEQQVRASVSAEIRQLEARLSGLLQEMAELETQIEIQDRLVVSARDELQLASGIAERGFVSKSDLLRREEAFLTRQQQATQLRRQLSSLRSQVGQSQALVSQARADAGSQIAALSGQRSEISQRQTNAEAAGAVRLIAPSAGRVTALVARPGQTARPDQPLMMIVPTGAKLQAELRVPSSAIGFVRKGQEVRLALDAYPYQRFGTVPATTISVASAPTADADRDVGMTSTYLVVAELERGSLAAFGDQQQLIPGMTLSARIVTEKQSLIEWLFEPLFAVQKR